MDRKKKRWLLGCSCGCGVLGLSALGVLTLLVWPFVAARMKPDPVVVVVTCHPGMPATSIEKTITSRIERWVIQAHGFFWCTSRSLNGISIVRVGFHNDIDPGYAMAMTGQLALGTLPTLPPDTLPPEVLPFEPRVPEPLGVLVVSSSKVADVTLRESAQTTLRAGLCHIPGVVSPMVLGGKDALFPTPTVRFRCDHLPALGVPVYPQRGANPKDLREKISRALSDLELNLPPDIQLRWVPFAAEHRWFRAQDDGLLTLYVRTPSYCDLGETEKSIVAVERLLENNIPANEREAIVSEIGLTPDMTAIYTDNTGPQDATIRVQLSGERTSSAAAYTEKLRRLLREDAKLADLGFRFAAHDMPDPVDIRIEGGKTEAARPLAQEVRKRLASIQGTADGEIVQRMGASQLTLHSDHHKATTLGLSGRETLEQALAAFAIPVAGREIKTQPFTHDCSITVPFRRDPAQGVKDPLAAKVAGGNAKQPVKLSELVDSQLTQEAIEIDHYCLKRIFNVRANIEARNRREVLADIRKMLQELQVPKGIKVELAE
jgi:multidrug efflux pump subunit AcrB